MSTTQLRPWARTALAVWYIAITATPFVVAVMLFRLTEPMPWLIRLWTAYSMLILAAVLALSSFAAGCKVFSLTWHHGRILDLPFIDEEWTLEGTQNVIAFALFSPVFILTLGSIWAIVSGCEYAAKLLKPHLLRLIHLPH